MEPPPTRADQRDEPGRRGPRGLRGLLSVLGAVAATAGAYAVIAGPGAQTDGESIGPSLDSEYRFYASFWLAFGIAALRAGLRGEPERALVRGLGLALLAGALARVVAWTASGRPHVLFVVLLGAEVAVSVLLLAGARRLPAPGNRPPGG